MAITFIATLNEKDWRADLGGWDCSALEIPGATVSRIFLTGTVQDTRHYQVDKKRHAVRWAHQATIPKSITVEISLSARLNRRWVTVVTAIIVAIISALSTIYAAQINSKGVRNDRADAPAPSTSTTSTTLARAVPLRSEGKPGYLSISVNPWATVRWTNGDVGDVEVLGTRARQLELKPGIYNLLLVSDKFCPEKRTVTVTPARTAMLNFDFYTQGKLRATIGRADPCK